MKIQNTFSVLVLTIVVCLFQACSPPKHTGDTIYKSQIPTAATFDSETGRKAEQLIMDRCARCHANGYFSGNLANFQNAQAIADQGLLYPQDPDRSLFYVSIHLNRMPEDDRPFSEEDKAIIKDWILNDVSFIEAKNELGEIIDEDPLPEFIDYTFIRQEIIEPKCLLCHSSEKAEEFGGGNIYETYQSLLNQIEMGDSENSNLFQQLEAQIMPASGNPLTARELLAVKRWIDEGAAE